MEAYFLLYIMTVFLSIAVMAGLAVYSWRHRRVSGALAFSLMMALGTWGALAEGLSILSGEPGTAGIWYDARFLTLACLPVAWLIFTLRYTGRGRWINRRRLAFLLALPLVTLIMILTNDWHGLWASRNVVFTHLGRFMIADTSARIGGTWFWVHSLYSYGLMLLGMILVLRMAFRVIHLYRGQAMALSAGTLIMILGALVPTFNLFREVFRNNPITQSLALSSLVFFWAMFRYRFLDMGPVAREMLIDSMEDSMIVLDLRNRVLDLNAAMHNLLREAYHAEGRQLPKTLIGLPAVRILSPWRDLVERFRDERNIQSEVSVSVAGTERFFDLRISPLLEDGAVSAGRIIVLRDITLRKWEEGRLKLSEARLQSLYEMGHRGFSSEKEIVDYALNEAVRLTGSEIGYFHFVKEDGENLELFTWSRDVLKTCTVSPERHYPLHEAGIWADCARLKSPVVHNDYPERTDRRGYPEGHSPIWRHMSVPVMEEGRVMAISGVANKALPYDDSDVLQMRLLMDGLWKIIKRRRAEEALRLTLEEKDLLLKELALSEKRLRERNARMEKDLKIAQAAQKGLMRGEKPECRFLSFDYRYKPMEKVGGDYFSFFGGEGDSLGFFIGDVSGHGIAAALFIALLKSTTDRMFREHGLEPDLYLKRLNGNLVDYMSSYFLSGVYGCFQENYPGTGVSLRFANGGHAFPVLMRWDGSVSYSGDSGTILGVTERVDYRVHEEQMHSGDRLFLYTDGIPETVNTDNEMIGFEEELLDLFRKTRRVSLPETLDALLEEIRRFRGEAPPHDDITLIGFEIR